ncbi:hypothetical protein Pan216_12870 [Planctomycetes bacterium Pan216]|uniref:Uncharacterized protein n=1 Tax=Kolteria novifilia TaxID=2527975 RepID=A0A518B0D5_9BACT|nr:hypothetical protein Pan216_12870 [Planctomycetes bacterium Pan216]
MVDQGPSGPSPTDILEYTLRFQVSDYFAFDNVIILDTLTDGQTFDMTFAPVLTFQEHDNSHTADYSLSTPTVTNTNGDIVTAYDHFSVNELFGTNLGCDGATEIAFDVSGILDSIRFPGFDDLVLGGLIPDGGVGAGNEPDATVFNGGPTTGELTFRFVVNEEYRKDFPSGDAPINSGDQIGNHVDIQGDVLNVEDALTPTGSTVTDTSNEELTIVDGSFNKRIDAFQDANAGSPTILPPAYSDPNVTDSATLLTVRPGDLLTYRLTVTYTPAIHPY